MHLLTRADLTNGNFALPINQLTSAEQQQKEKQSKNITLLLFVPVGKPLIDLKTNHNGPCFL